MFVLLQDERMIISHFFQGDKMLFDLLIRNSSGHMRALAEALESHGGKPSIESEAARTKLVAEE